MKNKQLAELRDKTVSELNLELGNRLKSLMSLNISLATQQSTNTSSRKKLKTVIAQIKTIIHQKRSNLNDI